MDANLQKQLAEFLKKGDKMVLLENSIIFILERREDKFYGTILGILLAGAVGDIEKALVIAEAADHEKQIKEILKVTPDEYMKLFLVENYVQTLTSLSNGKFFQ